MTASVAPSFNLQKVHKAVDRTGYLPMNEWITTNPCNVSADTCANALNSPLDIFFYCTGPSGTRPTDLQLLQQADPFPIFASHSLFSFRQTKHGEYIRTECEAGQIIRGLLEGVNRHLSDKPTKPANLCPFSKCGEVAHFDNYFGKAI